jgi:Fe-S cluster assembly protein SufD
MEKINNSVIKNILLTSNQSYKFIIDSNKDNINFTLNVNFDSMHTKIDIKGIIIVHSNKVCTCNINVNHNIPHCKSDIVVYGFCIGNNSVLNWNGNVVVNKFAKNTTTYQLNKNYLWGKNSKVNTKPILITKTYADAGHKSIVLNLDNDILFYLNSKGLKKAQFKKLLINSLYNSIKE